MNLEQVFLLGAKRSTSRNANRQAHYKCTTLRCTPFSWYGSISHKHEAQSMCLWAIANNCSGASLRDDNVHATRAWIFIHKSPANYARWLTRDPPLARCESEISTVKKKWITDIGNFCLKWHMFEYCWIAQSIDLFFLAGLLSPFLVFFFLYPTWKICIKKNL